MSHYLRELFDYQRRVLASPALTRAAKYVAFALVNAEDHRTGVARRTVEQLMADTGLKRTAVYAALHDLEANGWIASAGRSAWERAAESVQTDSAEEPHAESVQTDSCDHKQSAQTDEKSAQTDEKSVQTDSAPLTDSASSRHLLDRDRARSAEDDEALAARRAELKRVHDRETGAAHEIPIPPDDGKYHLGLLELAELLCELVPKAQNARWLTRTNLEDALRGRGRQSREHANAATKVREVHAALEDLGLRDHQHARRVVRSMLGEWWAQPFTQGARSPFLTLEPVATLAKVERQERERGGALPSVAKVPQERPATPDEIREIRARHPIGARRVDGAA